MAAPRTMSEKRFRELFRGNEVRNIFGFGGLYKIDRNGNVFSLKNRKRIVKLKQGVNNYGYCMVSLKTKNHVGKTKYIARMVAIAFIKNPLKKSQVNHKNGDKKDNTVKNLEWCTPSENIYHLLNSNFNPSTRFRASPRLRVRYKSTSMPYPMLGLR